jgi:hypothetical protein
MSLINLFEEELEKELKKVGLTLSDVESYEREGKEKLVLYLKTGIHYKINNPYLARLAEAKTNEEILVHSLSRDALLKRLYALENIFKGRSEWEEFKKRYSSFAPSDLLRKIREMEKKYQAELSNLKDYLISLISSLLTSKASYYPTHIYILLGRRTTQELAEIYTKLSSTERISEEDLEILLDIP